MMDSITTMGDTLMVETRHTLAGNALVECQHNGWLAWVTHSGQSHYLSPQTPTVWLRSTAKPFQAVPLLAAAQQAGRLDEITPSMLAVASASHVGSLVHQQAVTALLAVAGLDESALGCGQHPPLDKSTRRQIQAQRVMAEKTGEPAPAYSPLGHNCSGNHAGQLVASVLNAWPLSDYRAPQHPVQQAFVNNVTTALDANSIQGVGVDGCGIPTLAVCLPDLARLYADIEAYSPYMSAILAAIASQPVLFGGTQRVDSAIVEATDGVILAKVGADGVMAVCNRQKQEGLAIKMAHGGERARNKTIVAVLQHIGWLTPAQCQHPVLAKLLDTTRKNGHGKVVGGVQFPCLAALPAPTTLIT